MISTVTLTITKKKLGNAPFLGAASVIAARSKIVRQLGMLHYTFCLLFITVADIIPCMVRDM